ncbi:hypothetical protein D9615_010684 [Tricholomella constricta]|uniref:peptidylprolyl isomerase n=1 Tax=Tricholomella constricta TaxID=117010 RepID=A0A8H5GM95_9AGAR|nr:hypothetical protein D9615_010684 [Tricholomella constricta]
MVHRSLIIAGNKQQAVTLAQPVTVINAALGVDLGNPFDRSTLLLSVDEEAVVICSLVPRVVEQYAMSITLRKGVEYVFRVNGPNLKVNETVTSFPLISVPPLPNATTHRGPSGSAKRKKPDNEEKPPTNFLNLSQPKRTFSTSTPPSNADGEDPQLNGDQMQDQKRAAIDLLGITLAQPATPYEATSPMSNKNPFRVKQEEIPQVLPVATEDLPFTSPAPSGSAAGIEVQDATVGKGRRVQLGDAIAFFYEVSVDGVELYQHRKGRAFEYVVGSGTLVDGFDDGIIGMMLEGHRIINLPNRSIMSRSNIEHKGLVKIIDTTSAGCFLAQVVAAKR